MLSGLFPMLMITTLTLVSVPCQGAELSSCLTHRLVKNFTLHGSTVYFNYLNFSIQNLRYTEISVPKPQAIVMPESKQELVETVICCRRGSLEIRVRSGGHSYEGTSAVATDGLAFVIIDMMNLNRVELEGEVGWVEGGATLGETYYAISKYSNGLGFSAGSCPTVGIGGHVTGGGFGLLSRKYGLAADNVVDALLVDAEGRLLDRKGMGEDVFWAIRGGGGGIWGIVYAWKIQLSPVPQIVTAFIVSRTQHVAELLHKWQYVAPNLDDGFYLSVFVGAGGGFRKDGVSSTFKGLYLGPTSEALSILDTVFPELGIRKEECKEMRWIESVLYFSEMDNIDSIAGLKERYMQNKGYFKAKSDYVRTPISTSGIRLALDNLGRQPKGCVILDPYGGSMQRISSDSIAFPHRKGNLYAIQYLVEWKEQDKGKANNYLQWIRGFHKSMRDYVSQGPRAAYVNYMDLDLGVVDSLNTSAPSDAVEMARVWGEKYFLNNYDRLVRAKTLIDPHNVFRHQQGIPPITWSAKAQE